MSTFQANPAAWQSAGSGGALGLQGSPRASTYAGGSTERVASRDHGACRAQAGALSARDPSLCHRLVSTGTLVIWRWRRYKLRQYVWNLPEREVQPRFGCTHCNGGTWIDYRWS